MPVEVNSSYGQFDPSRHQVLVVDDQDATRYATVRTLQRAGYATLEAISGEQALMVDQPFSAVVLDVRLPDIDGFEVCRRLRERQGLAGLPVLHLSAAYVDDTDRITGLNAGADAYLTHPVDPGVIIATLQALLRAREAQQRLHQLEVQQYEQIERARDLFMGVLSHDLRSPLNAMLLSVQALMLRDDMAAGALKTCARILKSGGRMRRMLEDLHDFARTRLGMGISLQRTAERLDLVLMDALEELRGTHPTREIAFETHGDLTGQWDPDRMARLVSNLVRNAIQHGAQTTPVEVSLREVEDLAVLSVHNAGRPIEPAMAKRIFEPLVRGASVDASATAGSENMGLGLFICREIAQAHGGNIRVDSSEEAGTTFTVEIPKRRPVPDIS